MPSKQDSHPANPDISLGEAATQFLSKASPQSANIQQEVFKFIRWYGENKKIKSLSGQEVANYSEQINSSPTTPSDHLLMVKQFLSYLHKQKLTNVNLAAHMRKEDIDPGSRFHTICQP